MLRNVRHNYAKVQTMEQADFWIVIAYRGHHSNVITIYNAIYNQRLWCSKEQKMYFFEQHRKLKAINNINIYIIFI